jgi:hypothetical protein
MDHWLRDFATAGMPAEQWVKIGLVAGTAGTRVKKRRGRHDWQTSENVIKTSESTTTLGVDCSRSSQESVDLLVHGAAAEAWRSG